MKLKTMLIIVVLGVTLDIASTLIGLNIYHFTEKNPWGFNPVPEYFLMIFFVCGMHYLSKTLAEKSNFDKVLKLGNILTLTLALSPYLALTNNMWVIFNG